MGHASVLRPCGPPPARCSPLLPPPASCTPQGTVSTLALEPRPRQPFRFHDRRAPRLRALVPARTLGASPRQRAGLPAPWRPTASSSSVSMEGIFNSSREAGIEDGKALMSVLAAGPRHLVFLRTPTRLCTPARSTSRPWAPSSSTSLPAPTSPPSMTTTSAGSSTWASRSRWRQRRQVPRPPPGFSGSTPPGYHVARCDTYKALIAIRALPIDGDVAAWPQLRGEGHPLQTPPPCSPTSTAPPARSMPPRCAGREESRYWRRLHSIINTEPSLDEFRRVRRPRGLGVAEESPSPRMSACAVLERAASFALEQMRVEGFVTSVPTASSSGRTAAGNGLASSSTTPTSRRAQYLDLKPETAGSSRPSSPPRHVPKAGGRRLHLLPRRTRDQRGAPAWMAETRYKLNRPPTRPREDVPGPSPPTTPAHALTGADASGQGQCSLLQTASSPARMAPSGSAPAPTTPAGQEQQWIRPPRDRLLPLLPNLRLSREPRWLMEAGGRDRNPDGPGRRAAIREAGASRMHRHRPRSDGGTRAATVRRW